MEKNESRLRNVLVVGIDSSIGSSIFSSLRGCGWSVSGTTRRNIAAAGVISGFDMLDVNSRARLAERSFSTVVLCAGITSVETCETLHWKTREVNVDATVALATAFLNADAHVIFFSTNMVFDGGEADAPPDRAFSPATEYGRQKAAVEFKLSKLQKRLTILRLGKVLGSSSPLLSGWIQSLRSGEKVYPFNNKRMAPIAVSFLSEVVTSIIRSQQAGLVQLSADKDITYSDAAMYLAERLGAPSSLVKPRAVMPYRSEFCPRHTTLESCGLASLGFYRPTPWRALDFFLAATRSRSA